MLRIAYILTITVLIASCTEVTVELPPKVVSTSGKVILIEEVTGVQCSNCPRASAKLEEIADQFDGNVIVVGVHGTQQTEPYSDSKYSFSNDDAKALEEYLRPWLGKPAAAFNRRMFADEEFLSLSGIGSFQSKVELILQEPQTIDIATSFEINADSTNITINAGVTALQDLEGDFYISAMVTESHIIDYQLDTDFGGYNKDYEHNHVLRDIISNTFGDEFTKSLAKGDLQTASWNYTIPTSQDGLWKRKNLEFIVFITDRTNDSKEVIQAARFKLKS